MSDQGALATLLIQKGVITSAEYEREIMFAMEREVKNYGRRLSELTGRSITLA
jgi:hypothetical protein